MGFDHAFLTSPCLTSSMLDLKRKWSGDFFVHRGRLADCYLESVGKPVFHAHSNTYFGSWMRDAYPRTGEDMMKRWLTNHFQGDTIEEYMDEADMRRERVYAT
uniref:Olfactomedin-like domain-containing protein n=1 Tax=Parascaris equorum TaxID=6256 RepID=A0A914RHZ1_PAREQ